MSFPSRFVRSEGQPARTGVEADSRDDNSPRSDVCELVVRVGQGDRTAFERLYHRTSSRLFGAALRILGDRGQAEDAVQEAYVRVWRGAGTFDPARGQALPWMGQIVRNACFDSLAKRQNVDKLARDFSRVAELDLAVMPIEPPDAHIRTCLERLPPNHSRALVLMYVHGMSHPELAAYLGVPLGTAKAWVTRGAKALRTSLGGQNDRKN